MLTGERGFSPLSSHIRSHHGLRSFAFMVACAVVLTWWGGQAVLFPNMGGAEPVPASGAAFMPLLLAIGVPVSTIDGMGDFSKAAALPRRRVRALHLAGAFGIAVLLACAALLVSGDLDTLPLALRNLLGFTGLAGVSAAILGFRLSWLLPLVQTVPAFLLGTPGMGGAEAQWWEWPRASMESGLAWGMATALMAGGTFLTVLCGDRRG
ncbi:MULTISPECIES: hypothetical protein [unclassified Streptomyces]|uniref:hypothetical protein n=1 Tax=unclassified Streptomyces TaxID=2593676 RepID=UPI001F5C063C|nr:hypothetical protein [Streptomyces sp. HSG2]